MLSKLLLILLIQNFAQAELPVAGVRFIHEGKPVEMLAIPLDQKTQVEEFRLGVISEVKKARQRNPDVSVVINWADAPKPRYTRSPSAEDSAESLALSIASEVPGAEVAGSTVPDSKVPDLDQPLTPQQETYARRANRTAFIVRVGGTGAAEVLHLMLYFNVPPQVAILAGAITAAALWFNTWKAVEIANLINYRKWINPTDQEAIALETKVSQYSGLRKKAQMGSVFLMSFLYEAAFHGVVQGSFKFVLGLEQYTHSPITIGHAVLPLLVGALGEMSFDLAQVAYQSTRSATLPNLVRNANMRLLGTLASLFSVAGILMASDQSPLGWVLIGGMTATGLSLTAYYKNTEVFLEAASRVKQWGRSVCNRMLGKQTF